MGYEIVAAPGNFFYSHSYDLGYAEPVLVTGIQADYKLSDNWNVNGGFNRGWAMFEDNNESFDFLGGAEVAQRRATRPACRSRSTSARKIPPARTTATITALVFKQQLSEKSALCDPAQHGRRAGNGEPRSGGYAEWYGLAQYLIYTINPKWSAGTRVEWFRDQDGVARGGRGQLELRLGRRLRASRARSRSGPPD